DLLPLLKDTDASVRFHAVTALGRAVSVLSIPNLLQALADEDAFVRHASFRALNRIGGSNSQAWPQIVAGLTSAQRTVRDGTLFALRETWSEGLVAALAAQLRSETNTETRAAIVAALGEIARQPPVWDGEWWGLRPVTRPRPARTQDWAATPIALEALRR